MSASAPAETVGDLLRFWRGRRGTSQLDLALAAGVSARHLSFIESGRSRPGKPLLLALADTLNIPLRERNTLFLAADYAPPYRDDALHSPAMAPVLRAVDRMLQQQNPYPALLLSRHWDVLRVNDAAPALFSTLVDMEAWPRPRNLLRLVLSPHGLRPSIQNWPEVAAALLLRVQREAVGAVHDDRMQQLLAEVHAYPGVSALRTAPVSTSPVVPITFARAGHRSSWFSLVSTVGTPGFITAQELRVECMFPAEP